MAKLRRKGPEPTEFEIINSPSHQMEAVNLESNKDMLNTTRNESTANDTYIVQKEDSLISNNQSSTPTFGIIKPEYVHTVECDSCRTIKDLNMIKYCKECKQTLCDVCLKVHDRLGGTRKHLNSVEKCWPESEIIDKTVIAKFTKDQDVDMDKLSADLSQELGMQVSHLYDTGHIEVRAPSIDVLELAIDTINAGSKHRLKRVKHGLIEWKLHGQYAYTITKLFKEQLNNLNDTYEVSISIKCGSELVTWPKWLSDNSGRPDLKLNQEPELASQSKLKEEMELVLRSSFDNYYAVNCEIEGLKDEVETLSRVEILRPKKDEVRMKLYVIMKDNSDDVICHMEKVDSVYKLVIQGPDVKTVENVRHEFLSLFCKECSSCKRESARPTFLECKHVLCHNCVKHSACLNDGLRCPICSDTSREKTPMSSLQLRCLQVIDNKLTDKPPVNTRTTGSVRKQSSFITPQVSVKIPKYLLQKWKKLTGGISRLKSIIENNYGLKVAGIDDNTRIYGQIQEILDLAVQSIERLNEKTPETGTTQRLADKCVEWRLRGEQARIAHFLFKKELYGIRKTFNTVSIQAFTESDPTIVDVKCGYEEFLKVRYEIEELENDIRNLYTDECIQPKNFYHGVKIKEYLQSKRRDEKVHCSLVEKNNVNAVLFRGRKKEFITAAKEQLMKW